MSISQVRPGAIFVGWVIALFLLFMSASVMIAYFILQNIDPLASSSQSAQYPALSIGLLAFLAVFASFFAGGYVAGRMAAFAGAINGAMIVTTTVVITSFAIMFVSIVEGRLGVEILTPAIQAAAPHGFKIFTGLAFALFGSMLGGKYGEGYVDRLDLAMNVTKPMPQKHKVAEKAPSRPQQARPQQAMPHKVKVQQAKAGQQTKASNGKKADEHKQVI